MLVISQCYTWSYEKGETMKEMELVGLRQHENIGIPIMLLKEPDGDERILPIFIGKSEALAIALAMEGVTSPRPMTHDLMAEVIGTSGMELLRVEIVDLEDRTFFAEMEFGKRGDEESAFRISSRPSDAIALAIRMDAPVFAVDKVLDEAGFVPSEEELEDEAEEAEEEQPEEVIEQFKEFIDNVSAEDFEASKG